MPEGWHAMPKRWHAMPERWNAVPEYRHAVPEGWNANPKPSTRFVIDSSRVENEVLLCVDHGSVAKSNTGLHIGSDTDNLMI